MSTVMEKIEKSQLRSGLPELRVGSSVRVNYRITEGNKERIQAFEGVIIGKALYEGAFQLGDALATS